MGCIYFVRHGESEWNLENRICGAMDSPLTEKGHQQALETGRNILRANIRADMILYSPLSRAADTARHIADITGLPCREEPRLKEQDFGSFEGTCPRDSDAFRLAKQQFAGRFSGGESMLQVAQRVYNLLDELQAQAGETTYILVSHTGIGRVVKTYFEEMTNGDFAAFNVPNCSVIRFDFPEKQPKSCKAATEPVARVDAAGEEKIRRIAALGRENPNAGFLIVFRGHTTPCTFDSAFTTDTPEGEAYTSVAFWDEDTGNLFDFNYREVPLKVYCNGRLMLDYTE